MSLFDGTESCHLHDALPRSPTPYFTDPWRTRAWEPWGEGISPHGPCSDPFQQVAVTHPSGTASTFSPRDVCPADCCQRRAEKRRGCQSGSPLRRAPAGRQKVPVTKHACPRPKPAPVIPLTGLQQVILTFRLQMLVRDWYKKSITPALQLPFSLSQDQSGENLIFKSHFSRIQNHRPGKSVVKSHRGWHTFIF